MTVFDSLLNVPLCTVSYRQLLIQGVPKNWSALEW